MINQKSINHMIVEGLKSETGCEVIKANISNAPIPSYPYISFSILNAVTKKGTYGVDGNRYIPLTQTWSFTVQDDDDDEAFIKAMTARDWLEEAGAALLNENGIVVQSVGAIQNRDTLLTVAYEYRKGFDVVFSLMNEIVGLETEAIEQINIEKE